MGNPRVFDRPSFFGHNMPNNIAIEQAIADLKTQTKRNYYATAKKYGINHQTLQRRFEGTTASKSDGHLETQGLLKPMMEKVLVDRINTLSFPR